MTAALDRSRSHARRGSELSAGRTWLTVEDREPYKWLICRHGWCRCCVGRLGGIFRFDRALDIRGGSAKGMHLHRVTRDGKAMRSGHTVTSPL